MFEKYQHSGHVMVFMNPFDIYSNHVVPRASVNDCRNDRDGIWCQVQMVSFVVECEPTMIQASGVT
jgi:hypothetical protein